MNISRTKPVHDEALSRWMIDSATDFAMIATDLAGRVTTWSLGAKFVFEWTEEQMVGQPVDRIFTPEDLAVDRPLVEMRCALETGAGSDERWHMRKSGERFWASGEMTVLRDDAGTAVGFVKVLRDRTEQRLATESLRGDQANIRLLLDSMAEGLYAMDRNGTTTVCNAAFVRLIGCVDANDAVGHRLHGSVHARGAADAASIDGCPICRCARDGTPAHVRREFFHPMDDRPAFPVEYWVFPIRHRDVLQGAICTFLPLADEYDASERLQLALAAGAIVGTWVWDVPNDRFIADDRFAQSIGIAPERCRTGVPLHDVTAAIHEDDRARVDESIQEALRRGGPYRCQYRIGRHDGSQNWVEASGRVELDDAGRPLRFPGVLLDISARRAAEAERDRLTQLLSSFTAAVPGVVYAKDRAGRLLVGNDGTTELIGKPPESYVGKTDMEVLDDKEQAALVMATDRRIMETGVAEQVEEDVRMPDGTPVTWLSIKKPLLNAAGEVIGLVGSSMDVTARKIAEAEVRELNRTLEERVADAIAGREEMQDTLRQSQKMEAVGQLTGGLAHDFNNLLTGMMGNLELLQARIARGKLEDLDRFILAAQGAGRRAASLTQRLLAFSRRQTLDPKPTDVNRLVSGMEDLLRRTVGPESTIEVVGAVGLWTTNIDAGQLENALLNLCINGRDAMPDGGRLTIETANKWLDERAAKERDLAAGQYVSVCVTDSGTGMTADTIKRAFEPFFTTKPIGQGTGLGLSMVYGFARQSGGQVRIYSEMGSGTTVCVYLPRDAGVAETMEISAILKNADRADGQVVLVVDDEATIRDLIDEVLGELGFIVIGAADGASGMKVLQSGARIDLLVTDVGLPNGMNGRQMADAARTIIPNLKVLFITGYAENAAVGNGHLERGMELLTKPFAMDALALKVSDMLKAVP